MEYLLLLRSCRGCKGNRLCVDQFDDGIDGDRNIILTSVLKVMSINVERA